MSEELKPKLIWTGIMIETEDGDGIAYPLGNFSSDGLLKELVDVWNEHVEQNRRQPQ